VQPDVIPPPVKLSIQKVGVIHDKGPIAVNRVQIPFLGSPRKKVNPFRGPSVSGFLLVPSNFTRGARKLVLQTKGVFAFVKAYSLGMFFHDNGIGWTIIRTEADETVGNEIHARLMAIGDAAGVDAGEQGKE